MNSLFSLSITSSHFGDQQIGERIYPKGTALPAWTGPSVIVAKNEGSGPGISQTFVGDSAALPTNRICEALALRIQNTILDCKPEPFHVYITLPVHSEGSLDNGMTTTQVHWTMQTLVFGTHSLLNRIRRALKAREMMDKGEKLYDSEGKELTDSEVYKVIHHPYDRRYEEIPLKKCFDYVTLLNLRNWEKLGDRYVTEQIYGHTKLMIVDDRYVLVGSANINDRSLLGTRDSELAVMIMDSATGLNDVCGNGNPKLIRQFAHELRKAVWKKIFGITGKQRPATELETAIEQPINPKSWQKIQAVLQRNTRLYEAAFKFIPRNESVYPIDKEAQFR